MSHFKKHLRLGTPKALECCRQELKFETLHDLHHGNGNDEKTYILKMSISTIDGGLWGDFIAIYWIYIYCSIHVWNKRNGQIIVKVKQKNGSTPLNLVYGNNHF